MRPIFDDITLCKHDTAEENAFTMFNSFSYTKKKCHLSYKYCYRSESDFDYEFTVRYLVLCYEMGKIWRMVIRKNITLVV